MTRRHSKHIKVYLDQKDWINLARAYYNRSDGQQYKAVLKKVVEAVENKKAIFPLSFTHVIETNKRRDLESRKRLASFMAEISQGNTIAPQFKITLSELNHAIATKYKTRIPKSDPVFGFGIPFAFGMTLVIKDKNDNSIKPTTEIKQIIHDTLTNKSIATQILIGNDKKLVDAIKFLKENRRKHVEAAEELRKRVRDYDKRLLKRAYVANLLLGLHNDLSSILTKHGQTIEAFLKMGSDQLEPFFAKIPSLDTEIELATKRNEHWDKSIEGNDVSDITSLSVAIPYCDIVVTEVFWTNILKSIGLDKKYNTKVISSLDALLPLLP
jgi:hypothetical protein